MFSVCIPSVRPDSVGHAVRAVRQQTWVDWELLVASQNDEVERAVLQAAEGDARVRVVPVARRGAAAARNGLLRVARGNVLAFTDDDCEPAPNWLEVLARAFQRDPEVGVVSGSLLPPAGLTPGWLTMCPVLQPREARYVPTAVRQRPSDRDWVTANVAIRADVVADVGMFDEVLGPGTPYPSGEDTDYRLRIEARGVPTIATPESVVFHTYGVRSGVRAGLRQSRAYARGNGALAAKLTLQGDGHGETWKASVVYGVPGERHRDLLPHRAPLALLRRWSFLRAYADVLARYDVRDATLVPTQTDSRGDRPRAPVAAP